MSASNINRDPRMVSVYYQVHQFKANQDMITTLLMKFCELVNVYHDFPVKADSVLKDDWWYIEICVPREWTIKEEEWWGKFRKAMEKLSEPPEHLIQNQTPHRYN
jgi:hypothetical protein